MISEEWNQTLRITSDLHVSPTEQSVARTLISKTEGTISTK